MTAMRKFKSGAFEAVHSAAAGMDRAGAVEKWETGAKKPSGAALKLLSIVQKDGLQILTWPMSPPRRRRVSAQPCGSRILSPRPGGDRAARH